MRLTKDQRFTAYCIMLAEYGRHHEYEGSRFCHLIYKFFGIHNQGFCKRWDGQWFLQQEGDKSIDRVLRFFPELDAKKPSTGWPYTHVDGIIKRKKWLKQCIIETHP